MERANRRWVVWVCDVGFDGRAWAVEFGDEAAARGYADRYAASCDVRLWSEG